MNTLQANLETAINRVSTNSYSKAYIDTELNKKAALVSPAFTGTATAINLTVSSALIVGTTNVLTSLNSKVTTTDVALKAPLASPVLSRLT